jgi:hypothetical protein
VQKHENSSWSLYLRKKVKMDEFDIVDNLVLNGGLEFAGNDSETGEALYKPTDRLKEIDYKLNEELSMYFSEVTLKLWEKGFLDMDVTQEDPVVKLGPKGFDAVAIKSLPKDERVVIEEIVKALLNKN